MNKSSKKDLLLTYRPGKLVPLIKLIVLKARLFAKCKEIVTSVRILICVIFKKW